MLIKINHGEKKSSSVLEYKLSREQSYYSNYFGADNNYNNDNNNNNNNNTTINNNNNNNSTHQNSICRLCSERDETINHMLSECGKLAQKEYKTKHDWVCKFIPWEQCKKLKVDHTNNRYMHNSEPLLVN